MLCFGILCCSLKCGDKEVGLGDGHIGFHCDIGCGEGVSKGALVVFHLSGGSCGVLVIPVGGCGDRIGLSRSANSG